MTIDDDMIPDPVLEKASAWALRLHSLPDDAELRAALAAWIAESDVHARAWALTQKAWRLTGRAKAEFAREWPARHPTVAGRRAVGLRMVAASFAVAACLLLVAALPGIQMRLATDHGTSVGQTRSVVLDDGSAVHLGADSAIAVAFSAAGRQVTLLQGEAFFEVTSDPSRSFSVRSGDLVATVTGTAFDVALTDRSFAVTVASGSVRVSSANSLAEAVDLRPGQGVIVDRATRQATRIAVPPSSVASWRKGRLIVENAPLVDVVSALNRYREGPVVVASASLRSKRVTGVYDLNNPIGALRILAAPYGGNVHELSPYLTLLSAD
jgi:transmembrane sensor